MKNIKRLTLLAMLVGSVAILASCRMKLNSEQAQWYNVFIEVVEKEVKSREIPASEVGGTLIKYNKLLCLESTGFKIVDKKAGKPVAKGTKAAALKKRFVPKKA